jgi:hypothetical protein
MKKLLTLTIVFLVLLSVPVLAAGKLIITGENYRKFLTPAQAYSLPPNPCKRIISTIAMTVMNAGLD